MIMEFAQPMTGRNNRH